jgi:hypothetical protein
MPRLTRFELEVENASKALKKRDSALSKLSAPEIEAKLRKYLDELSQHMLGDYRMQLRKGTAPTADMGDVMRKAAEEYRASTPSPVDAMLDDINADLDALSTSTAAMKAAMPAFKRWAIYGIDDPAGIDVPHPRFDPRDPIRDYGGVVIAEKSFRFDQATGRRNEPSFTKFEMPQQQQQHRHVDLDAEATAAALRHRKVTRED